MSFRWRSVTLAAGLTASLGSAATPPNDPAPAPYFPELGRYHRAVTTKSAAAQRYFDQGLLLLYAFNLEEAQRSFEHAGRLDPGCASCFWGAAMALGPHINLAAQAERTRAAHQAAQTALAHAGRTKPVERALIEALATRYSDPPPADPKAQRALDEAYAAAMRKVAGRFPNDPDVQALFAEALMNLRPWDLWSKDGQPRPETPEIVATLERVLARYPLHPGANHYYIHTVEASPHPEKALAAAERLGTLTQAGHLVHMPAHIYMRVGRYEDAAEANRKAIAAEKVYVEKAQPKGFHWMYVAHNPQFLMAAAMMEGRRAEALAAAREATGYMGPEMLRQMPGYDFSLVYPQWVLVRFGRWDEALAEPAPPDDLRFAKAMWHAARGIAYAVRSQPDEAETERVAFERVAATIPSEATEGLNPASRLLTIARELLAGEIAARAGRADEAVVHLRAAVKAEDELSYNEPSDWYYPTRHHLGAVLLAAGRAPEAQAVFEEDLQRNPGNGWALAGLAESQRKQGKTAEATATKERLEKAWARADAPAPFSR
jgi:tetratricopeptide (TPR) repeat protein